MVTIYTLPNCVQCESTKKLFNNQGIQYQEIDLSEDADAVEKVKQMGYVSAPIVVAGEKHWSGFRLELIRQLAS